MRIIGSYVGKSLAEFRFQQEYKYTFTETDMYYFVYFHFNKMPAKGHSWYELGFD